jgi:hypothetical protein
MSIRRRWLLTALTAVAAVAVTIAGFVAWILPGRHRVSHDVSLPVRFDADRFYVEPITRSGQRLSLLTDTGGGLFLTESGARRVGSRIRSIIGLRVARLPVFVDDHWIPEPTGGEQWISVAGGQGDGMLGQRWFAGGVWTFDYPNRRLILRTEAFVPTPEMSAHSCALGFPRSFGVRTGNHPRIALQVADETVQALFDTGATAWLTEEARREVGEEGPSERATSFVRASLFDHWRSTHPEWRVVKEGCKMSGEDMIEAPEVEIAGLAAGPVWFTRRADSNYDYMSRFTDVPVVAAIGGNFLRHFRVTVDYPKAIAHFEPRMGR